MSIFFTADTHFRHERVMTYCKRPFRNAAEMDECLFDNWTGIVRPHDTAYHLGDVAFGNRESVFRTVMRLQTMLGRRFLIPGNHDYRYSDAQISRQIENFVASIERGENSDLLEKAYQLNSLRGSAT